MSSVPIRWPALDGLRGIAILLVLGFHLPWGAFRTGSYGVILFFVLSGFLITTILLRDLDHIGRIDLRRFYLRRARRLLPALMLVVAGHLVLQLTILGEPGQWWHRTWPVLAYVSNIVQLSGTSLVHMGHTWSLAVEEHFYLLWPLALILIPRRRHFTITAGLTLAFIGWRLILLTTGAPNLRLSFGTDSNAFAPLLGCLLAIAIHEQRIPSAFKHASALSVCALMAIASLPLDYTDRRVLWGSLPVALISLVAIHAAIDDPSDWLQHRTLRWFGMISYGLYLWHYMLISLPWEQLVFPPLLSMTFTSITFAWLSWRFVESPILGQDWRLSESQSTRTGRPAIPRLESTGVG